MRRAVVIPMMALVLAACASSPMGRAYQAAVTIEQVNTQAATALDFDMIDADTGEYIQIGTRTATADLKRVVADIKAGRSTTAINRILDAIDVALKDLLKKLSAKGVK